MESRRACYSRREVSNILRTDHYLFPTFFILPKSHVFDGYDEERREKVTQLMAGGINGLSY